MSIRSARRPHALIVAGVLLVGSITAAELASSAPARRCWGRKATIVGRAGQRMIIGTKRSDVIVGSSRGDVILGRGGKDRICARGGRDRVRAGRASDLVAGGAGRDSIKGGRGADDIDGGAGNDRLAGGRSDTDYLLGGPGNDTLKGGRGSFDAVAYTSAGRPIQVNVATGVATGEGRDSLRRLEDVVGSNFADTLIGDASRAGNGFVGGRGDDTIDGGGGPFDVVFFTTATGPVTVDLNNGTTSGTGTDNDTLVDIEDAQGSRFDDTLMGNDEDNFLWGVGGLDALDGRAGSDVLGGAFGNDSIDGGAGFDYASYTRAGKRTTVDLGAGTASVGDREFDTLSDIEGAYGSPQNDRIAGSRKANELFGLAGSDEILGLDGDDLLDGDLGQSEYRGTDTLDGGPGDDTCVNGETVDKCESESHARSARLSGAGPHLRGWARARRTTG
jgi:Ca2+-binding RTX toxin-like protein